MASSRLPNKPLADIAGLPMVVRVAQRAKLSAAARVVVAADDQRIVNACQAHGIDAVLTRTDHPSGSDRLAQACELLKLHNNDIVVNVQGDEPLIPPALIRSVAASLAAHRAAAIATACHPIASATEFANPNVVKVVCDRRDYALYFSRAPIPWQRDGSSRAAPQLPQGLAHRHRLGQVVVRDLALRAGHGRGDRRGAALDADQQQPRRDGSRLHVHYQLQSGPARRQFDDIQNKVALNGFRLHGEPQPFWWNLLLKAQQDRNRLATERHLDQPASTKP